MRLRVKETRRAKKSAKPANAKSGPTLSIETKLMQQYRVASPVHAGGQVAAVRDGSGDVQIFTIGTDLRVYNFFPDPSSDTGYSQVDTGIQLKVAGSAGRPTITAEVDDDGLVVVFACGGTGKSVIYVKELAPSPGTTGKTWTTPAAAPLPTSPVNPAHTPSAVNLSSQIIGGQLYVSATTNHEPPFYVTYSNWTATPGQFQYSGIGASVWQAPCIWSGYSASTATLTCLDLGDIRSFNPASGDLDSTPLDQTYPYSQSVAQANGVFFAVKADGNIWQLNERYVPPGQECYYWQQLTTTGNFASIGGVIVGAANTYHLFALGTDERIYRLDVTVPGLFHQSSTTTPAPIHRHTAALAVARNDGGDIELFAIGTGQSELTRLVLDTGTGNWTISKIEVQTSGQVEDYPAYSTDVVAADAAGAILVNEPLELWATAKCTVTVNGRVHVIGPNQKFSTTANAAGRITLTQEAGSLGVASLLINIPSLMQPTDHISIDQYAGVKDQLGKADANTLMNAQKANGSFLLNPQNRNTATATALAQACNQCMALADSTMVRASPERVKMRVRRKGIGMVRERDHGSLHRIIAPKGGMHWRITKTSHGLVFEALSAKQAARVIREKKATLKDAAHIEGFFSDVFDSIGDFITGVYDKIVEVVDTVVTTVGNAVKAAITFVVDGVTYLFNTVVEFVEQAFDLVETVFAKAAVFFEDLYQWLGFFFDWDDILRARDAISYTVETLFDFLKGATKGIKSQIDAGFATAQQSVDTLFDDLLTMIGGTSAPTISGYIQSNNKPSKSSALFDTAAANNIVLNGTLDNISGTAAPDTKAFAQLQATSAWQTLMNSLHTIANGVENSKDIQDAMKDFSKASGSPDQILNQTLSGLVKIVKAVIKIGLSGVQAIIDGLLDLVSGLIDGVRTLLLAKWDIPFVSDLYMSVANKPLTTLDLASLIAAIPATIIYKAVYDAAPFPDDTSVNTFKSSFDAQTLLSNSGLGGTKTRLVAHAAPPPPHSAVVFVGIVGLLATFAYGAVSAALDVEPMDGTGNDLPGVKSLSIAALAFEMVALQCANPWITGDLTGPDCTTQDGAGKVLWVYSAFGVLLDTCFFATEKAIPENDNTIKGLVVATLFGAGHALTLSIVGRKLDGLDLGANILIVITECLKWLRAPKIVTASKGLSLLALAGLDGLLAFISGLLGFISLIKNNPQHLQMGRYSVRGAVPLLV